MKLWIQSGHFAAISFHMLSATYSLVTTMKPFSWMAADVVLSSCIHNVCYHQLNKTEMHSMACTITRPSTNLTCTDCPFYHFCVVGCLAHPRAHYSAGLASPCCSSRKQGLLSWLTKSWQVSNGAHTRRGYLIHASILLRCSLSLTPIPVSVVSLVGVCLFLSFSDSKYLHCLYPQ